jgi:hypothetical protein
MSVIPATQEVETVGSQFKAIRDKKLVRPPPTSTNKAGCGGTHLSFQLCRGINRRITAPAKTRDPTEK